MLYTRTEEHNCTALITSIQNIQIWGTWRYYLLELFPWFSVLLFEFSSVVSSSRPSPKILAVNPQVQMVSPLIAANKSVIPTA